MLRKQTGGSMLNSYNQVLKSALLLGEVDRILLAIELYNSVGETMPGMSVDDPELLDELQRRTDSEDDSISIIEFLSRLDSMRRE